MNKNDMIKVIIKKLKTLISLDIAWAFKYYKKKISIYSYYFISKILRVKFWETNIRGLKIKLGFNNYYQHHIARNIAHNGNEKEMFNIWREASRSKHTVVDLGGYNGIFGIISALANPESKVYIFEPDPTNCKQIRKNISLNHLSNVELIESAVADKNDTVHFDRHTGGTGGKISKEGCEVSCITLNTFFKNKDNPTLMKVDIEGAEQRMFEGAKQVIKSKPEILLEAHWAFLPRYGDNLESSLGIIKEFGYKTLWLDGTNVANH